MRHGTWADEYHALPDAGQTVLDVTLVLVVGTVVAWLMRRYAVRYLQKAPRIERTLRSFLANVVATGVWIVVVIVALSVAGVDLTTLLGGLAVGGFILGFALKDTLGNLAAGVVLLFYRPFNLGDAVTIAGHDGAVQSLGVALTALTTPDGRIVTIPNGKVLSDAIVNNTRMARRRVEVRLRIAYGDDVDAALATIMERVRRNEHVLADPAPLVQVAGLSESGVDLQAFAWVPTGQFGSVRSALHADLQDALLETGCKVPYPTRIIRQGT